MQKTKKKITYFEPNSFVDLVVEKMNLGATPLPTLEALREEITALLGDRIIATVVEAFGEREMTLLENMLHDHPELDEMDAIMIIAPQVPGIKDCVERAINSLFKELTMLTK